MNQTAGEKEKKVREDTTRYDPLEVGHAICDDFGEHLIECARRHENTFDQDEFCIVYLLADDPILSTVKRRKFYAWPFLPKPRPNQGCFLYNKVTQKFKRLWILPCAATMANLSCEINVDKKWKTMKCWSDAFYKGLFHESIRLEHGIDMLSEKEFLDANRDKLIKSEDDLIRPSASNALDFAKVAIKKIVDTNTTAIK